MDIKILVPQILTFLTVSSHVLLAGFIASRILAFFIPGMSEMHTRLVKSVKPYFPVAAFIIALTATLGSLFYSEILKYEPCRLCWYQRILMYPQTLLFALGIIKRDKDIADYGIALSVTGASVSGFHYYLQNQSAPILSCSAVGYSSSCTQRFAMEYGYISIPMMALTAFVLIITLMLLYRKSR